MPEEIEKRAARAIEEHVFPGCVIGISERGKRVVLAFGTMDGTESTETDTIYDVASVTKSIPTASLALTFIEKGWLRLSDRVASHLPDLRNHYEATVEDLLRYRVAGVPLSSLRHLSAQEMEKHILERGFSGPPGVQHYTNLPAYLLGKVLESASGELLGNLAAHHFFLPLHMQRTSFGTGLSRGQVAPSEIDARGLSGQASEIRGLPHDESAYIFQKAGIDVGHAGLFSTVPDLLTFLEMMLRGLAPYLARGAEQGLGWQVNEAHFMGSFAGSRTFGKTGFTGTSVLSDVGRGVSIVILSNRTYPKRPPDAAVRGSAIDIFRADIADIVLDGV